MFGGKIGLPELAVVVVILLIFGLWSQIFHKAGYSRWLALLLCVPVANLVLIIWFAFANWPVETELRRLRANSPSAINP
jgi:hypothetical protein